MIRTSTNRPPEPPATRAVIERIITARRDEDSMSPSRRDVRVLSSYLQGLGVAGVDSAIERP